ncbi:alpha/beta fold hydrolase [Candidatus Enterovibrio altilux]|uniref:Esterase ybfF n=1 Tax=Candidatus Enterovibrio altilux TaxID=1927128 RepID=A0A291B7M2_9GAMM|nr:alpha/beta fold hydrolase [Candidatus Enterovibrio luxaltus]ATF08986.1 Esterase ybfF [Candidatus Enterovibrio luxaltus]
MFLNFTVQGAGQPLLLIHGLFGSLSNLNILARALAKYYQVYRIDLPNHGQSPHSNTVNYVAQAIAVKDFIDQQGLKYISIVGHSMGGKVAMALAITYKDLVDKLVVMDIAPVKYNIRHHDTILAGLSATKKSRIRSRKEAEITLFQYIHDPNIRQFLLKSLAKQYDGSFNWRFNVDVFEAHYDDIIDWPLGSIFTNNTLFLKGANSDYISAEYYKSIKSQFPQAKVHVVANTSHWLHTEKPDIVARIITRFLINLKH